MTSAAWPEAIERFRERLSEYGIDDGPLGSHHLSEEDAGYVVHAYVEAVYPAGRRWRRSPRGLFKVTELGTRRTCVLQHVVDQRALRYAWEEGGAAESLRLLAETDAAHPDEVDV